MYHYESQEVYAMESTNKKITKRQKCTRKLFYFASLNSKHEEGWANCIIGPSHTDAVNQFTHKAGYYQNTGNYQ